MIVDVQIKESVAEDIRSRLLDGRGNARHERCGILYGERRVTGRDTLYVIDGWDEVPNSSTDRGDNFKITGKSVLRAIEKSGRSQEEVLGPVHTHPAGSTPDPSKADILDLPSDCVGIVLHATTKRMTYYDTNLGFIKKDDL